MRLGVVESRTGLRDSGPWNLSSGVWIERYTGLRSLTHLSSLGLGLGIMRSVEALHAGL